MANEPAPNSAPAPTPATPAPSKPAPTPTAPAPAPASPPPLPPANPSLMGTVEKGATPPPVKGPVIEKRG